MQDDEQQVDLKEGMQVSNEEGEELGTLAGLLVEEDEEEAEFIVLRTADAERLVPFDAVLGVGDGALVLDVARDVLSRYPAVQPGTDPSDEDVEKAYEVYDETGTYTEGEEKE